MDILKQHEEFKMAYELSQIFNPAAILLDLSLSLPALLSPRCSSLVLVSVLCSLMIPFDLCNQCPLGFTFQAKCINLLLLYNKSPPNFLF